MSFPIGDESVIIGYRKFKSKKGFDCCLISVMSLCCDRDLRYGACGYKVQDVFVPEAQHNLIVPDVVGKPVVIHYEINGGNAYVRSIEIS